MITKADMDDLSLHQNELHGEWTYSLHSRVSLAVNYDQSPNIVHAGLSSPVEIVELEF